jgi:hypothetical protein
LRYTRSYPKFGNYATMMGSTILRNCEEGESFSNQ